MKTLYPLLGLLLGYFGTFVIQEEADKHRKMVATLREEEKHG